MSNKPFKEAVVLLDAPFVPNKKLIRESLARWYASDGQPLTPPPAPPSPSEAEALLRRWVDAIDAAEGSRVLMRRSANAEIWTHVDRLRKAKETIRACESEARALVKPVVV